MKVQRKIHTLPTSSEGLNLCNSFRGIFHKMYIKALSMHAFNQEITFNSKNLCKENYNGCLEIFLKMFISVFIMKSLYP